MYMKNFKKICASIGTLSVFLLIALFLIDSGPFSVSLVSLMEIFWKKSTLLTHEYFPLQNSERFQTPTYELISCKTSIRCKYWITSECKQKCSETSKIYIDSATVNTIYHQHGFYNF